MRSFVCLIKSEALRMRHTTLLKIHLILPAAGAAVFLVYYSFSRWDSAGKVLGYLQVVSSQYGGVSEGCTCHLGGTGSSLSAAPYAGPVFRKDCFHRNRYRRDPSGLPDAYRAGRWYLDVVPMGVERKVCQLSVIIYRQEQRTGALSVCKGGAVALSGCQCDNCGIDISLVYRL